MIMSEGVKLASEIANSPVVFSILFILLVAFAIWYGMTIINDFKKAQSENIKQTHELSKAREEQLVEMMKENKADSSKREEALLQHNRELVVQLNKNNDSLKEITRTQGQMQNSLHDLQLGFRDINNGIYQVNQKFEGLEQRVQNIEKKE